MCHEVQNQFFCKEAFIYVLVMNVKCSLALKNLFFKNVDQEDSRNRNKYNSSTKILSGLMQNYLMHNIYNNAVYH